MYFAQPAILRANNHRVMLQKKTQTQLIYEKCIVNRQLYLIVLLLLLLS